jgi:nitrogen fixation protein FixH
MNFGVKITILYLSFVGLILTLVFMAYGHKVELVSKDYYAQELKYQDKIDAMNNANALEKSISHMVNKDAIELEINSDLLTSDFSGTIYFFRPSDSEKDKQIKMNFTTNKQIIPANELSRGAYKMQLTWTAGNKQYFKEEVIFVE